MIENTENEIKEKEEEEKNKKKKKFLKEMNDLQKKQFELLKQIYKPTIIFNENIIKNILKFISLKDILNLSIFFVSKSFFKFFDENSDFWEEYCGNLWIEENNFNLKKNNFKEWKKYLMERGKMTIQPLLKIEPFISNPNSNDTKDINDDNDNNNEDDKLLNDIHLYIGAYKMKYKNCTYLKYLSMNNSIICECILWSLKFPTKFIEINFQSKQDKYELLIDDMNIFIEDNKIDEYFIQSIRDSLKYDFIIDNHSFIKFIFINILRYPFKLKIY